MNALEKRPVPAFPGWAKALGPGVVWMALAQGSGELVWWPYMIAKYGLGFLFLLLPACLLQFPLNYEIGRYTVLTGETIWQGFIRLNKAFAFFLWVLMITSFFWFGAFASAGGTALASLTGFPSGASPRVQSLFWGYLTIAVFVCALTFSRVVYNAVEKFMIAVVAVALIGLLSAASHPQVSGVLPQFLSGLFVPQWPEGRLWDNQDATKLLTAITFAGLGGFWTLFYSYWLREKGSGMAKHFGRITSPVTGKTEAIPETGFIPDGSPAGRAETGRWLKFLSVDCGIGVLGNLLTTLLTCLLAYALLFPEGIVPKEWEIAVVQARFFEVQWGAFGRLLFLAAAAAFLSDTWMATADAVARVNTDIVYGLFPRSKKFPVRFWYYAFLAAGTVVTCVTMLLSQPGPLILLSAVIGFAGTVIFSIAVLILNHRTLPRLFPESKPKRITLAAMLVSVAAYLFLMLAYLYAQFF